MNGYVLSELGDTIQEYLTKLKDFFTGGTLSGGSVEATTEVAAGIHKLSEKAAQTDLEAEVTRAKEAEETLQTNVTAEETRAKEEEKTLQDNIDAEVTRAKAAEEANTTEIANVKKIVDTTGATSGQVLTKTDEGTEWQDPALVTINLQDYDEEGKTLPSTIGVFCYGVYPTHSRLMRINPDDGVTGVTNAGYYLVFCASHIGFVGYYYIIYTQEGKYVSTLTITNVQQLPVVIRDAFGEQGEATETVHGLMSSTDKATLSGTGATTGYVLTKTENGVEWKEATGISTEDKEKLDAYPTYAELLVKIQDMLDSQGAYIVASETTESEGDTSE